MYFIETLRHFNWVDFVVLLFMIRFSYVGVMSNFLAQIVPFLLTLVAFLVSVHFYEQFAVFIAGYFSFPVSISELLSFLLFFVCFIVIIKFVVVLLPSPREEGLLTIQRILSLALGFLRGIAFCGMVIVLFLLTPVYEVNTMVPKSITGMVILKADLFVYSFLCQRFVADKDELKAYSVAGLVERIYKSKDFQIRLMDYDLTKRSRFYKNDF